jgi:hypothetical protein
LLCVDGDGAGEGVAALDDVEAENDALDDSMLSSCVT